MIAKPFSKQFVVLDAIHAAESEAECGTNGDLMYAQLSGISAVDFDTMQTLTMTVDGAEIVLSICPLSYAVAAKNDIAKSMVLYSTATDAFVASL